MTAAGTAVVIGIDPHKRSNTALVLDAHENVLAKQRFANDRDGYRQLKQFAQPWRQRTWAVEGARGVGLGLAQRIAGDGEQALNVPARLPPGSGHWVEAAGGRPTTRTPMPLRSPACADAICKSSSPTRYRRC